MALLLKFADVHWDFATGSLSAMNSGTQRHKEEEQVVTTQGRKRRDGELYGGAESSVRIPLFRGFASSSNPAAKQEGPEGCCTRENQNAKANAAANCLRIDTFHASCDEGNRENQPGYAVKIQGAYQQSCDSFIHCGHRWE
jgi:hypothetical protein